MVADAGLPAADAAAPPPEAIPDAELAAGPSGSIVPKLEAELRSQRARLDKLAALTHAAPSRGLYLIIDQGTSEDVVAPVLATASRAGFNFFVFVVQGNGRRGYLEARLPAPVTTPATLVRITANGFEVSAGGSRTVIAGHDVGPLRTNLAQLPGTEPVGLMVAANVSFQVVANVLAGISLKADGSLLRAVELVP